MYSSDSFNALPSLGGARRNFVDAEARVQLEGPIRDLFVNSPFYERLGVSLLHRHFPLLPDQRLVDYNHTSTAWQAPSADIESTSFKKYDGLVVPRAYLFNDAGGLLPYEFDYVPCTEDIKDLLDDVEMDEFLLAFHALLNEKGLQNVFGLRDLRGHDPTLSVEVTEGRANIMLPPSAVPAAQLIEAMWTFSPVQQRCHCREYCLTGSQGHIADHACS